MRDALASIRFVISSVYLLVTGQNLQNNLKQLGGDAATGGNDVENTKFVNYSKP